MLKKLFILPFILACGYAEITLQNINSKPPSRAKNFMIWQYLKQDITSTQADKAYEQVLGENNTLLQAYLKKSRNNKYIQYKIDCRNNKDLLHIQDKECLNLALNPYKTLAMTKNQRLELAKKLDSASEKEFLRLQNEPFSQKNYESYSPNAVLRLFISTTAFHRRKNLNIYLDEHFINTLVSSARISQLIQIIVYDDALDQLQKSILNLHGSNLDSQSNFLLALHCLRHSKEKKALEFFEFSRLTAKKQIDRDKSSFWIYQISKNKDSLNKLLLSMNINMYTLYAHELSGKVFNNYFATLETVDRKPHKNIQDPFEWDKIYKEIQDTPNEKLLNLAKTYNSKHMVPIQSLIIEKANAYQMHSFIMPYDEYLDNISIDEKALVYAIMKQESLFIPAALSRSFALGLMQLMPFVTDDLSKKIDKPIKSYDEMFIPKNNIKYALKHLAWMKKSLYHPVFMAYAYNGGMGFLRRHLEDGTFKDGKYEPFFSMEFMQNAESREYGKKVLANYVMYKKILGEDISIIHLFDTLMQPKMTDRFRAQG